MSNLGRSMSDFWRLTDRTPRDPAKDRLSVKKVGLNLEDQAEFVEFIINHHKSHQTPWICCAPFYWKSADPGRRAQSSCVESKIWFKIQNPNSNLHMKICSKIQNPKSKIHRQSPKFGALGPHIKNCYSKIQNLKSGRKSLDSRFWIGEFWGLDSGFWILERPRGCTTRQFSDGASVFEASAKPTLSDRVGESGKLSFRNQGTGSKDYILHDF